MHCMHNFYGFEYKVCGVFWKVIIKVAEIFYLMFWNCTKPTTNVMLTTHNVFSNPQDKLLFADSIM